jgi:Zn-dependent protease with chaperone function
MTVFQAGYFDGKTSRRHEVSVVFSRGRLRLVGEEILLEFDARNVRRSLRVGDTPRWLYLPGGGACVTRDNDAVDHVTRKRRYERLLYVFEARPVFAAIATLLIAGLLWLLVDRALPAGAQFAAERIPVAAENVLGADALSAMERFGLAPSRLPEPRRQALQERFQDMVRATGETTPYRLEFRASPTLGANAFALPGGIIVMTDELVRASRNEQEVLAVIAHELGHVRHRHVMRRLLEGSAIALILAGLTGDIASSSSLAAAAPSLLLQLKYSRDNEREADRYAIQMMKGSGLEPRYLGSLLKRLEEGASGRGMLPSFLSSHPATEERDELAAAGSGLGTLPMDPPSEDEEAERNAQPGASCRPEKNLPPELLEPLPGG